MDNIQIYQNMIL